MSNKKSPAESLFTDILILRAIYAVASEANVVLDEFHKNKLKRLNEMAEHLYEHSNKVVLLEEAQQDIMNQVKDKKVAEFNSKDNDDNLETLRAHAHVFSQRSIGNICAFLQTAVNQNKE